MRRLPIRYLAAKIFTDVIFADSFAEIFYRQKTANTKTANTKTANQKTTNKSDFKKSVTYKTSGGFTLVELMIVIALLVLSQRSLYLLFKATLSPQIVPK